MEQGLEEEQVCPTWLLGDTPSDQDAFRHGYIAKAIAGMILNEDGGRAIALTGPWGSGKSTVVALLAADLAKSDTITKVIAFDAWAHQGDPLRRTFLELAITELKDFLDEEKWKRKQDILARRLIVTNTHTKPELTVIGVIGAFALLVSPVGFQLFATLTKNNPTPMMWPFWVPFLLGSAPLFIGLYLCLVWLRALMRGERKALPSLIYSSADRTTTSSNRTAEPTSVEFEEAYCELLRDAISDQNRKVVIVIDNLDRLEDEDAKTVWSTLRTFFDKPLRLEDWFRKTWILVPFHDKSLDIQSGEDENPHRVTPSPFIDKTFQAFFRIPPALLTNWEAYLVQQLEVALPDHKSTDEFHDIFRLYDHLRDSSTEAPTPRQLKLFVNKVGALHRQWQHIIPLTTQAAFVLLLEKFGVLFSPSLRNSNRNDFLAESIARRLQGEWQRDLAAVYFNVLPDAAFEALLLNQVTSALTDKDASALVKLEDGPGFSEVLQNAIELRYSNSALNDQGTLAFSILGMANLRRDDAAYEFCRKLLYDRTTSVEVWSTPDAILGKGLASICIQNPGESIAPVLTSIENSLPAKREGASTNSELKRWCLAVTNLVNDLRATEAEAQISITVRSVPLEFVNVVNECLRVSDGTHIAHYLRPSATPEIILAELAAKTESAKWEGADEAFIAAISAQSGKGWDFAPLVDRLAQALGEVEIEPDTATRMLNSLDTLMKDGYRIGTPELLAGFGSAIALANYPRITTTGPDRAGVLMSVLLVNSPLSLKLVAPRPVPAQGGYYQQQQVHPLSAEATSANEAKKKLESVLQGDGKTAPDELVLQMAREYFDASLWRVTCEAQPDRLPFVVRVSDSALDTDCASFFEVGEMLDNVEFWQPTLEESKYFQVLKFIGLNDAVATWLHQHPYDERLDRLYELVLSQGDNINIASLLIEAFQSEEKEEWLETLTGKPSKVKLLGILGKPDLGIEFENALFALSTESIANDTEDTIIGDPATLLRALSETNREGFYSRLADWFRSGKGEFAAPTSVWSNVLADAIYAKGLERAQERFIDAFGRGDVGELEWIANLLQRQNDRNGSETKSTSELKAALRQLLVTSEDGEYKTRLSKFAESMAWKFRISSS